MAHDLLMSALCMERVAGSWIGVAFAVVAVGCSVSPVPEPPDGREPTLSPQIELGEPCRDCAAPIALRGAPGAAQYATEVWAVNLNGTEPPVVAPTQPDGSFVVRLPGTAEDQIRLQAR